MSAATTDPGDCLNAQFHGNPFRYCPSCTWREETLQERAERVSAQLRDPQVLQAVRELKADAQAALHEMYAPESARREADAVAMVREVEAGAEAELRGVARHADVTAPIAGESLQDRLSRVIRHVTSEHPEMELMDSSWLDHPLQAHEALHQQVPSDLPVDVTPVQPRLGDDVDLLTDRLQGRLSEMLGATLQPIVINALKLQIALTVRAWLQGAAYGLPHDSREQLEMLRLAEMAILES